MKAAQTTTHAGAQLRSPLVRFAVLLAVIAAFTALGPAERTLGANARVVYLHGAWVWTALAGFGAAAAAGTLGLVLGRRALHAWSLALGRTGLFFWITYLPISIWAMQTNWNGLFLAEPRWRLAAVFAVGGLLLQLGLALMDDRRWASASNLVYLVLLGLALANTENVMHPPAPMLESNAPRIQSFFGGLLLLSLITAWQVAGWWYARENSKRAGQNMVQ